MAVKTILVFCASVCLFKLYSAQCIGSLNGLAADELALGGNALAYGGLGAFGAAPLGFGGAGFGAPNGYGLNAAPSSGGGFAVTSYSPITPTGITVVSENAIEGPLTVTGQLPFLGAIAVEGALPSAGAGAINYGCGNGAVGIVSEGIAPAMGPGAYPAGPAGAAGIAGGLGYGGAAQRSLNGLNPAAGLGYRGIY